MENELEKLNKVSLFKAFDKQINLINEIMSRSGIPFVALLTPLQTDEAAQLIKDAYFKEENS